MLHWKEESSFIGKVGAAYGFIILCSESVHGTNGISRRYKSPEPIEYVIGSFSQSGQSCCVKSPALDSEQGNFGMHSTGAEKSIVII